MWVSPPDVFGANRRQVESLKASAESQRFQLEAAYLALSSNVVAAAIQEASLRSQIASTRDIIEIETEMLGLLRRQLELGYVAGFDVAAQEAALAQAQQALPPLEKQLKQTRDFSRPSPAASRARMSRRNSSLPPSTLPRDLPVAFPPSWSSIGRTYGQRKSNCTRACAQVGVAPGSDAAEYHTESGPGQHGYGHWRPLEPGNELLVPCRRPDSASFSRGRFASQETGGRSGFGPSGGPVSRDSHRRFPECGRFAPTRFAPMGMRLRAAAAFEQAARKSLDLARRQFELGYVNYLSLLSAEQAYQQAMINMAQAKANRFSDTTALFMALGGGWWNRLDGSAG